MEILTIPFSLIVGTTDAFAGLGELPEGSFRGMATVFGGLIDAYCPTVIQYGAFTKTLQEKGRGVKVLWQHDTSEPIGLPTHLLETEQGLAVEAKISPTQRGKDCLQLMRDGVIDALSIGFDSIKEELIKSSDGSQIRYIKEVRLWEFSAVTWGADSNAKITQVHSTGSKMLQGKLETNGATPYGNLPLRDRKSAWTASAAIGRVKEWAGADEKPNAKYRKAFFWYDGAAADQFGSYKLPFADIIDGELTAIPRGIFAAAAAIQGSRGGVNIPDDDSDRVKGVIERYYTKMSKQFGDDSIVAPWDNDAHSAFGSYEIEDALFLLGQKLVEGFSLESATRALTLIGEVESSPTLTSDGEFEGVLADAELMFLEMNAQSL